MSRIHFFLFISILTLGAPFAKFAVAEEAQSNKRPAIAFTGLHGGVYDELRRHSQDLNVDLFYLHDDVFNPENKNPDRDLSQFDLILIQHVRKPYHNRYTKLIRHAKRANPKLRVFSISGLAEGALSKLVDDKVLESDQKLTRYYGTSRANLKHLLNYLLVKYCGQKGVIQEPEEPIRTGLYHPDHKDTFKDVAAFSKWRSKTGVATPEKRAVIAVHHTHLILQQPRVVDALIREFEKQGICAVAVIDLNQTYEQAIKDFQPHVIIHTCHSREHRLFREQIGVPHLHSLFFRKQSIRQWHDSLNGLAANEIAFQITSQEIIGAIEPQIGAGTLTGGGSAEAFTPIPERIEHLVRRARSWIELATLKNSQKKVAIVYWNREMGKGDLMRGSATGMFLNAPRSIINLLNKLNAEKYTLKDAPKNAEDLVARLKDHGQQLGIWSPAAIQQLATSGNAVLVSVTQYQQWLNAKVSRQQRAKLEKHWGPAPGRFMVWNDSKDNKDYFVIPRVNLGNVILLPQPLRGEAQDSSLVHDKRVPPPHNYLATYFWLQEQFKANALIHFGTHGTEFILPGKGIGLSRDDWPDIVIGDLPNINPWVVNNLGESSPVRRRAYAVLINHLSAPLTRAELSDELLNLHNDLDKWETLESGALRTKFQKLITDKVKELNLEKDLKIELNDQLIKPEEIAKLGQYLHKVHNETIPASLHCLGEPPAEKVLIPYITVCLGRPFLKALRQFVNVPKQEQRFPGDEEKYLGHKANELLSLLLQRGFNAHDALATISENPVPKPIPAAMIKHLQLATNLKAKFAKVTDEVDNIIKALAGKYISPGPGNTPDRNPGVLPTGRNMYLLNPEEVPSKPSWELGKTLVQQMLAAQLKSKGNYPQKVGFSLNSFATFQDFGVMEAQILYLIGARPVWDQRNRVVDIEVIPVAELKRPRIDVFIASGTYYRDMLPTRMRLIDKAVRVICQLNEPGNALLKNSQQLKSSLVKNGRSPAVADVLANARMFGYPEGQMGSASYYYLVERSGEWDTREQLMETYLAQVQNVYTKSMWGKPAKDLYERAIENTEVVLRSWSDRVRSPLSNKYVWYKGGSLCFAIEHLTGKRPQFLLSDLRDPENAHMVNAEDALRLDFRSRLFNRKWIEAMKQESYAGADQIAKHVSNAMGWEIMRPGSVSPDIWEKIVDVYIRDQYKLNLKQWFESENPHAQQELTEILLETIRKGYWKASEQTTQELAKAYAESVLKHGESGGLFAGGHQKLKAYIQQQLVGTDAEELGEQLAQLEQQQSNPAQKTAEKPETEAVTTEAKPEPELVEGKVLTPQASTKQNWIFLAPLVLIMIVGIGFGLGIGSPKQL